MLFNLCRLDKETGELYMRGKIREGDYQFSVRVYDKYWTREVQSSVTVKVREIGDEAIFNSGSIRLTGEERNSSLSTIKCEYLRKISSNHLPEKAFKCFSCTCKKCVLKRKFNTRFAGQDNEGIRCLQTHRHFLEI